MLRLGSIKYNQAVCSTVNGSRNMCGFNAANSEKSSSFRERVSATICGNISHKPIAAGRGAVIIPMITRNADGEQYTRHKVFAPLSALKNVSVDRLVEGDRIYAWGVIRYMDFQNSEGRQTQHGEILPSSVFLCEQSDDPSNDINQVSLFGLVKGKSNTENVTFLTLDTKFYDPKDLSIKTRSHDLMITDDETLREQASCMKRGLGVHIHGSLETRAIRAKDGKLKSKYFIRVQQMIDRGIFNETMR